MRVSHLLATLVALVIASAVFTSAAHGQGPAGQGQPSGGSAERRGTTVAVVDIKYIFDNLQRFKSSMDELKKEAEAFEASVRDTDAALRKRAEELKGMTPGSEPYKRIEEEIVQQRSQVQLDIQRKQKERIESEARIYHNAYQQISDHIRAFADRYGIDLVLQHSRQEIDPSKPDTVIRGLNRLVVFQRSSDITDLILQEMNRAPAPRTTPPVGVQGTTRLPQGGAPKKF